MIEEKENKKIGQEIAGLLLDIGAIKLNLENAFQWSSGWNSPIYCDNRLSLSFPLIRTKVKNALVESIKKNYPDVQVIAGVATAGIPQGALVADALDIPFVYVRSKPKGHGMENMIEGKITKGQKVVLIEDLVSTGGSSLKAAEALRQTEFEVLGMAAIFTYGFDLADDNFKEANISLHCLSNYNYLLQEALKRGTIETDQIPTLEKWRENPGEWKVSIGN